MATNRVMELAQVLRRLKGGEDPEQVKREAEDLVRSIAPQELSLAEQQLIRDRVLLLHPNRRVVRIRANLAGTNFTAKRRSPELVRGVPPTASVCR